MAEITRKTSIADAIRACPDAGEILSKHGLGCSSCLAANAESLEDGIGIHGLDVDAIVAELNAACRADD